MFEIFQPSLFQASVWLSSPEKNTVNANLEKDGSFNIETRAPVQGIYEYKILASQENKDTIVETLPVQVAKTSKLKMLILASSPQFELNYLKNYWVSQGHAIVQKVKISQEKYSSSFVNMDEFQFSTLARNVLERFDILMIDIPKWNMLSANERARALKAVSENGLGLILIPTREGETAKSLPRNKVSRFYEKEVQGTPSTFVDFDHNRSWLENESNLIYKRGFGNVLMPKTADSYRLILNDNKQSYQKLWGDIFSALYVSIEESFRISTPFLTYQGVQTEVQISNISQDARLLLNDSQPLILNYTPFLEGYGEAKVLPVLGWNNISLEGSKNKQWFYAHDSLAWKTMQQMNVNQYIQKLSNNNNKASMAKTYFVKKQLPFYLSLLMMVLGFGVVWFLEKLKQP